VLPPARCALTTPFQPYLIRFNTAIGGIFSAALSVGSRRPGVTWHLALWSPDFPPLRQRNVEQPRLSGQLQREFYPIFRKKLFF